MLSHTTYACERTQHHALENPPGDGEVIMLEMAVGRRR